MNKIHHLVANENGWEINFIHSIFSSSSIAILPSFDLIFWMNFFSLHLFSYCRSMTREKEREKKQAEHIVKQLAYLFLSLLISTFDRLWCLDATNIDDFMSCNAHTYIKKRELILMRLCVLNQFLRLKLWLAGLVRRFIRTFMCFNGFTIHNISTFHSIYMFAAVHFVSDFDFRESQFDWNRFTRQKCRIFQYEIWFHRFFFYSHPHYVHLCSLNFILF